MLRILPNLYEQWRAQRPSVAALRERGPEGWPSEKLLQQIWRQQRLLREDLATLEGERVQVLHPGFWNQEAGPDFKNAVIQIGRSPARSGDIEIDLAAGGWKQHGHAGNPAYANVILHVVWDSQARAASEVPTMALENRLDASLEQLAESLAGESPSWLPESSTGQCTAPLRGLQPEVLQALLRQAAEVRLRSKAGLFQSRARQSGWEQALWEGLFGGLGYKNNVWPMRRIAELLPCLGPGKTPNVMPPTSWQARLFGVANLLPAELTREEAGGDRYLARLWNQWWRERDQFEPFILPRAVWKFNGLRPANHPQRRLALAAHWLAHKELARDLESWAAREIPDDELAESLAESFPQEEDAYWSKHWTFRAKPLPRQQPLLGKQRLSDLAVNVVLPWLWIRAETGRNSKLRGRLEHRYFAWPAAEDNSVLKLARQRLLGGAPASALKTAALQQGLIQITRDFCDHSNAVCESCPFPGLVRSIA